MSVKNTFKQFKALNVELFGVFFGIQWQCHVWSSNNLKLFSQSLNVKNQWKTDEWLELNKKTNPLEGSFSFNTHSPVYLVKYHRHLSDSLLFSLLPHVDFIFTLSRQKNPFLHSLHSLPINTQPTTTVFETIFPGRIESNESITCHNRWL